jgi:peptidyl-prolyl cis-trans isomerase C
MFKKLMLALICGGVAVSFGCNKTDKPEAKTADKPVAEKPAADVMAPAAPAVDPSASLVEVGSDKLTVGQADKQILAMLGPQASQLQPGQLEAMMGRFRNQAAERFVVRSLLAQESDKRKIKVTEKDIDDTIEMIKTRLPKDMTMEDVLKRENLNMELLRSNLTSEIRIKMLVESEIPTNTVVSDEEVSKFYNDQKERFVQPESVSARHILVKTEATDDDKVKAEKKAKIEGLRKQLVEGADFEKLAQENSDCPSKERGGDLGSFPRGQMVKAFEDAAFSQATNAVGPVVETQFGYHIIQVTEHEAGKTTPLSEVKEKLAEHLKQQKQMELFEAFIATLKKDVKITYSDLAKPAPEMPMMMPGGGE